MRRVAEVLEDPLPDAEGGPPGVEVRRSVPGTEFWGDGPPLGPVAEPPNDGLNRLTLVLHRPASAGADGVEGFFEGGPLLIGQLSHGFGGSEEPKLSLT